MSFYDLQADLLDGIPVSFRRYRGKVLLIVNVASRCGFTPQYEGLEQMYRRHHAAGLEVLGFPCDQFGHQEPGDAEEIRRFCSRNYDVTFPLFAKVEVNGPGTHPVFAYLKEAQPGLLGTAAIKWNFTKFLVDRTGDVLARYAPTDTPEKIERDILPLLQAGRK